MTIDSFITKIEITLNRSIYRENLLIYNLEKICETSFEIGMVYALDPIDIQATIMDRFPNEWNSNRKDETTLLTIIDALKRYENLQEIGVIVDSKSVSDSFRINITDGAIPLHKIINSVDLSLLNEHISTLFPTDAAGRVYHNVHISSKSLIEYIERTLGTVDEYDPFSPVYMIDDDSVDDDSLMLEDSGAIKHEIVKLFDKLVRHTDFYANDSTLTLYTDYVEL